jgi:hypothetical protein
MDVPLILEAEYIPEWRENKQAANPIKAILQPLTAGQRAECIAIRVAEDSVGTAQMNLSRLVEYGVKEIINLSAGGVPITTGRQLVASKGAGMEQLIMELAAEIILRNQERDLKNS